MVTVDHIRRLDYRHPFVLRVSSRSVVCNPSTRPMWIDMGKHFLPKAAKVPGKPNRVIPDSGNSVTRDIIGTVADRAHPGELVLDAAGDVVPIRHVDRI